MSSSHFPEFLKTFFKKELLNKIYEAFEDRAVILHGDHSMDHRQNAVDRFQNDPACQLFVGSMKAAGVGLTLTASSHVIFAELDWTPANVAQAEDRCHRIGQRNSVLIQFLVVDGSIDSKMAKKIVEKLDIIDKALDRKS